MFDTIIHRQAPHYAQHVHIKEERAPTDESIQLAEEMRQKLIDKLVSSVITVGEFKVSLTSYCEPHECRTVFHVRGSGIKGSFEIGDFEMRGRGELVKRLVREVSEIVAVSICRKDVNAFVRLLGVK